MATSVAKTLWRARAGGRAVNIDVSLRPTTLEAAYEIQNEISALAGSPKVGWKLGATSPAAQQALGLNGPFFAPLLRRFCHESGTMIALPVKHGPVVEAEFAILLGTELPARPEPYDRDSVAAAVAAVCPAIEIAGSRLVGGMGKPDPMMIVADGGSNVGFVQGEPHAGWASLDLAAQEVTLFINGEQTASGNGGVVMGHPLDALAWLANELSRSGRGLNVGDVITTGSCTGITPVQPGDTAVADFGELGTVQARFSE